MSVVIDGTLGITSPAETVQGALTTTGNTILGDASTDTLNVGNGGLVKDASGNVGIGTASPAQKLDIASKVQIDTANSYGKIKIARATDSGVAALYIQGADNAGTANELSLVNAGGSGAAINITGGDLRFYASSNTTERMRIDSSGNVGIGTASPGAKLDITNNQAALSYLIDTNNTTNGGGSIWRMITRNIANTGTTSVEFYKPTGTGFSILNNDTNASNFTAFGVGSSERMRIDSSGNLLVGTTSTAVNPGTVIEPTGRVSIGRSNNDNVAEFYRSGTRVGSIGVTTTNTSFNTSSDYRLKNTIAPMTGALAKVALLKPCTYKWNADGSDGQGFIAHELDAVVPGCVTGEKDAVDAEGNPQYQGIDTSFLVATLTAAIQEQQALITQLQADVATLKALSA